MAPIRAVLPARDLPQLPADDAEPDGHPSGQWGRGADSQEAGAVIAEGAPAARDGDTSHDDEAPGAPGGLCESVLVKAAVQGDPAAFAALYDRHFGRVYRACYCRTRNQADAEDLAQQTFLQAWRAIRRYRQGRSPFVAWLLAISHHLAADYFRQQRLIAGTVAAAATTWVDPPALLAASVLREEVRGAILQLARARRQVIMLRFIEGCSVAEVAAALGKTEGNIRVIQHRALAELRRRLAEPGPRGEREARRLVPARRGAVSSAAGVVASSAPRL